METFWLVGHEKLQSMDQLSPTMHIETMFESVFEPEFLQIIWKQKFTLSFDVFS